MTETRRYSEDATRGFVVRSSHVLTSKKTGKPTSHTSWWYGPGHGFGTTFGTLDYCVALFPSRKAAEDAIRTGYHGATPGRLIVETVKEARGILAARRRQTGARS